MLHTKWNDFSSLHTPLETIPASQSCCSSVTSSECQFLCKSVALAARVFYRIHMEAHVPPSILNIPPPPLHSVKGPGLEGKEGDYQIH